MRLRGGPRDLPANGGHFRTGTDQLRAAGNLLGRFAAEDSDRRSLGEDVQRPDEQWSQHLEKFFCRLLLHIIESAPVDGIDGGLEVAVMRYQDDGHRNAPLL